MGVFDDIIAQYGSTNKSPVLRGPDPRPLRGARRDARAGAGRHGQERQGLTISRSWGGQAQASREARSNGRDEEQGE